MKIAPVADVKARFSSFLDELERFILAHTPRFRRLLDAADRRIQKGRGLGHGAFWKAAAKR